MKWLHKLRQKTEKEKRTIALSVSLLITFIIALVWFTVFKVDSSEVTANTISPFGEIKQAFEVLQ